MEDIAMPLSIERRFFAFDTAGVPRSEFLRVERRSEGGVTKPWIVGYAARFGVDSLDGAVGEFTERIAQGAFADVIQATECRALWNHNDNMPLARFPDTLRLSEDNIGLRFEFPVSRASYAVDLLHNIEDGIVQGNSFSFVCGRDSWAVDERGRHVRTVEKVAQLWDVGPVCYPAYGDGGLDVAKRSFADHVQAAAAVKPPVERPVDEALRRYRERSAELNQWLKVNGVR